MHVVYDKIAIHTARRSPENNTVIEYRSVVINKNSLMHRWIAFITDDDGCKILKMLDILLIMDFPGGGGLLPCDL